MTDGGAQAATGGDAAREPESNPETGTTSPGTALMPVQAGVVVWTARQLLAASGHRPVDDTKLALDRIRKGIRSKVWKEAVRCSETMLELAGVRKPAEADGSELGRVRAIEITVVESGRGAAADADTQGLGVLPGGAAGDEA